jgi:Tfp pilus assembly protein PilF
LNSYLVDEDLMAFATISDPAGLLNQVDGFRSTLAEELANLPPHRASALHLAFLADSNLHTYQIPQDKELAVQALQYDPTCVDAHRILATPFPTSLAIQDLRELLFAIRPSPPLRPHIRILLQMGIASFLDQNIITATHAFEEILRLDKSNDVSGDLLILCYLKIIGLNRHGSEISISRSISQLQDLRNFIPRISKYDFLSNLLEKYALRDERWTSLSDSFECPALNRTELDPVGIVLIDWPDFIIDLFLFRQRPITRGLISQLHPEVTRISERTNKARAAVTVMERGLTSLEEGKPDQAMSDLNMSLRLHRDVGRPSERFVVNIPMSCILGLVQASDELKWYLNLRNWIRVGLLIKADEILLYEVLLKISEFLRFGEQITNLLRDIVNECRKVKDLEEWSALSKKAIAVSSLKAMMLSFLGKLDKEKIEWLIKVGIEDLFTSVNQPVSACECLPWLSEDDIEIV